MNRIEAIEIIDEYVNTDSLKKHLYAVEASMKSYAIHYGENPEEWGLAGLLHDYDWEICPNPEDHPVFGANILREKGVPENIVRAVLSHGDHTGIKRETLMEKTLFAVDELSGFVTAVALVRPSKSLSDVDVRAVKKKMKDKGFAKTINREDITKGAVELERDLDEHIEFVINSLKPISEILGLYN